MKKTLFAILLSASSAMTANSFAADFDFSGSFTADDDVLQFNISLASDSNVTLFSSSWDDGGLDPILAVWDAAGNKLFEQDDGLASGSQLSNGVSYDYGVWDSFFDVNLSIGDYIITVAQYDNFSISSLLSDGFSKTGNPNFTAAFGCSNGQFCGVDTSDDNRTSDWAFHILNVADADLDNGTVPEPSILALLGIAALGMASQCRRKRNAD